MEALELDPGISDREGPVDACAGGVASLDPSGNLCLQGGDIRDARVQTLAAEGTQLDLRQDEPPAVLRGVAPLKLLAFPTS